MEDTPEMTTILPSSISMDNDTESYEKTQKLEEESSYAIDVKRTLGSHHAENYAKSSYFIPVEVRFDEPRDFSNSQISPENPPTSWDENTDHTTTINEISASPNVSESITGSMGHENSNSQNQTENPQKIPTQNSGEIPTEITKSDITTSENTLEGRLIDSQNEGQNSQIFPENPHNTLQQNLAEITTKSDIPELQHTTEAVTESLQPEKSDFQKKNENPQNSNENPQVQFDQKLGDTTTANEIPLPLNTLEGITEPFKIENSDSQNLNENPQNQSENPQVQFEQKLADVTTTNETPLLLNTLEAITEPFKIENSDFQSQSENPQNHENTQKSPVPYSNENQEEIEKSVSTESENVTKEKLNESENNENQEKVDSNEEISKSSEEKQNSWDFPTENPQDIIPKLSENESATENKSETEIKFPDISQIISNNENNMATLNVSHENENPQDEILKAVESGNPIEYPTTIPESSTLRNDGENSPNIPELPHVEVQNSEENNAAAENLTDKDLIEGILELYNFDSQASTENPQDSREKLYGSVAATVMEIPNETGRSYDINIRSTQSEIPDQMAVESQNSGNPQKIPESVMESLSNSATNLGSDELPSTTQVVEIVKEIPDMPVNDSQISSENSIPSPDKSGKAVTFESNTQKTDNSSESLPENSTETHIEVQNLENMNSQNSFENPQISPESPNVTDIIISTNLAVETAPETNLQGNTQEYENPQVSTENAQNVPDFSEKNNFPEEKKEETLQHNENPSEKFNEETTEILFVVQNPENMNSQSISENPQISPESQNASDASISNNSVIETAAETKQHENAQNSMENTHNFPGLPYNMPDKIYVQVIEEPVIIRSFLTMESPIPGHSTEILSVSQENPTTPKDMLPGNLPSDILPASPENPTMPAQMVILTEAETTPSPNVEKREEKLKNINFNAQLSTESSQDAGVYMLMEMIVPAESVQEMPSTEQENSTQFLEKSQSREAKSLEIKPQESQATEERNAALEENIGEESMLATQVATTDDSTGAAYENPGFINLNDNMDIMDNSFPTSTSESGVTEITQNSGENQTNREISTTNAPSILSEDSLSTAKFEEVALMNEANTTPKAAAASMTTESSTKPNIFAETTLPNIEVTKEEALQTTTEKMEKEITTMLPDSATTMSSDTNGNTESTNTEMGEEPTATTINQFASLLAETEMNVHKAFETLREWIAHGQKLEDTTRNPGASDGLEAITNNPSMKDMTTMKSLEDTTNSNGENVTDMATMMHDNEYSKDIKENNTEIPNTTMISSTDDAMDKKHSSGQDEITSTTEGSSSDMEIKETSTGVADHTATTTEQGVAETTIVPTLARVKLEKDLTSINLTYLDDSSEEEELENDRSKEHEKLNSHSNSQENSQEIKNIHTTEKSEMEASMGITEMVKFIQHEITTAASDQEERKTLQPLTQASFMEEQQQQIETTTVKDISSPSTSTADEKEEETTEMSMMLLTTTPTTPTESATTAGKDQDVTETSNIALTATTEVPETTESSTNVLTTTNESEKTATDSSPTTTPTPEVTTHLPDTTTPDLQETSTTTTDINNDTTTLNPEEDEEFITTTMTTEEPEIETTTLLTTTVAPEPRSLPPPKLEYLQSEDGVEVFYGYSIVKHN
uniref:Uncharacterized protein n=1 Tax=Musca domestica TaxID=7370 RepID=T1P8R0_MUSDO